VDRDTLVYVGGRGTYSLLQFGALVVFSRLLPPSEYGLYAIGLATAALGNAVFFNWIKHFVLRFSTGDDPQRFAVLAHARRRYAALVGLVVVVGLLAAAGAYVWLDARAAILAAGVAAVLACQGLFELHLEYRRSVEDSARYAAGLVTKAVAVLGLGGGLALTLGTFVGPLAGVAAGFLAGAGLLAVGIPTGEGPALDGDDRRRLRTYGLPLAAMFVFTYVMAQIDRILLGVLVDSGAAGVYAVSYDIAQQAIFVPLMAVSLSYFPRAVAAYEGQLAGRVVEILEENVNYLVALGVPATVGLSLVAGDLTRILLDPAYAEVGRVLVPFVASGAFLLGFQEFSFNRAYQLEESTRPLSVIHAAGAGVNLLANLAAIPIWGVLGAAATTVVTYALTFALKAYRVGGAFAIVNDGRLWVGVGLGTGAMAASLLALPRLEGYVGLAGAISGAALVYLVVLWIVWQPELPDIGEPEGEV